MAKTRFELAEVVIEKPGTGECKMPEFLKNFRAALLLALLEEKRLTRRQFERCQEELKSRQKK